MGGTLNASTSNAIFFLSTGKSRKISFAFGRIIFLEKISRMPSAEMENFVEHTPGKALKILRRL